MGDSMANKIELDRWKQANVVEANHWHNIMASKDLAEKEEGYYRHADVMFLKTDNPTSISVVDIGGGPLSLTKHHSLARCLVIDPIDITQEYKDDYAKHNTKFIQDLAENFLDGYSGPVFDEVWMYNCLQHTVDPSFIMENLWRVGKVLRISEPTNTPINTAHPHTFTPEWYHDKLTSISTAGNWNRIDYDYPYVGGKWILKRYD